MKKVLIGFLLLTNLGCTSMSVHRYAASAENVSVLRKTERKNIAVGLFHHKGDPKVIDCRAIPIYTPDKESYAEFIRKAFISELLMADIYDAESDLVLSAVIDKMEVKSTSGAFWTLELILKSTNGHSFKVSENFKFDSAWSGDAACRNASQAFVPAVQNLIKKAVTHPDFRKLVR